MSGFQRHRRSGRSIATFTGFEADLLRSLTGQLVELLRREGVEPSRDRAALVGQGGVQVHQDLLQDVARQSKAVRT